MRERSFHPSFLVFLFIFLSLPLAAEEKTIPLLISDHHADHREFFLRFAADSSAGMLVLDAHADTAAFIERCHDIGNHNWIHALAPRLATLAWISTIQGLPRSDKLEGFLKSIAAWNLPIRTEYLSVEELRFLEITEKKLFISVDLDFFYSEDYGPDDVPAVLQALFAFTAHWPGPAVWAICLSRLWLPSDNYAWTVLEKTLQWLCSRSEFHAPELTLFNSRRVDTSLAAQACRAEGREPPALREADTPAHIRALIQELLDR